MPTKSLSINYSPLCFKESDTHVRPGTLYRRSSRWLGALAGRIRLSNAGLSALVRILLIIVLTGAMPARAQLISFNFPVSAIPDDDPAGLSSSAPAPDVSSVTAISVTLDHEWLGDLTLKVVSPNGSEFLLLDRPGVSPANPDGSSAVLGLYEPAGNNPQFTLCPLAYQFAQSGASMGNNRQIALSGNPALPNDCTYAAQSWAGGPFPAGTWTLSVSDMSALSTGVITGAEIEFTAVPEPAQTVIAAALALAVVAGTRKLGRRCERTAS
jgi:subtilisin-like proprotein convertase family protein